MQILKKDLKHGEITLKITEQEDLWHLSHILEKEDIVKGRTERKIKIGNDENARVIRKPVFLAIEVEKVEYEPENNSLKVLGPIKEGPDDVSLGSYHSFNLEEKESITIIKKRWAKYELDRLNDAQLPKMLSLLVLFDREDAIIATLSGKGYKKIAELKGDIQKKADIDIKKTDFYKEIYTKIEEVEKRHIINNIIIASPAFWKEYLLAKFSDDLKKKTIVATISDVSDSAINELMKRPELSKALENQRTAQELNEIEDLLKSISNDKAFYGLVDTHNKIMLGATEKVYVSETFLKKMKEKEKYREIDSLLMTAENMNAKIIILTTDEPCKKLDGLGGIAGTTRWKI
ncbi:MAG: mRNA surveillance protein pelota [Candidatus Woesearchaeota archaeon]|jgi:protein pelota